jgi:hypothetical protein
MIISIQYPYSLNYNEVGLQINTIYILYPKRTFIIPQRV